MGRIKNTSPEEAAPALWMHGLKLLPARGYLPSPPGGAAAAPAAVASLGCAPPDAPLSAAPAKAFCKKPRKYDVDENMHSHSDTSSHSNSSRSRSDQGRRRKARDPARHEKKEASPDQATAQASASSFCNKGQGTRRGFQNFAGTGAHTKLMNLPPHLVPPPPTLESLCI